MPACRRARAAMREPDGSHAAEKVDARPPVSRLTRHTSKRASMSVELTQGEHWNAEPLELCSPSQVRKVDHESACDNLPARHAHQLQRCFGRAARCNQVVDQQHALIRPDRVTVNLET